MNEKRPFRFLWLDIIRSQVRDGTLTANAGHLALLLAVHYINGSNNEAWPAQRQLAADAGLSERAVRNALYELVQRGLLDVERGRRSGTSGNVYQLREPAPGAGSRRARRDQYGRKSLTASRS